jgi:hypothetical protein
MDSTKIRTLSLLEIDQVFGASGGRFSFNDSLSISAYANAGGRGFNFSTVLDNDGASFPGEPQTLGEQVVRLFVSFIHGILT